MPIDDAILENLDNLSQEEAIEVAKQVAQEYKTLQSSTAKGLSVVDQAIAFHQQSHGDVSKLEDLQAEHPEVAKVYFKKFHDGKTIEEIKAAKEQELQAHNDSQEASKVEERLQMYVDQLPEDQKEPLVKIYKELVGNRKIGIDDVEKYVISSIAQINPAISTDMIEKAKLAAAGGSSNSPGKTDAAFDRAKAESRSLLTELGVY